MIPIQAGVMCKACGPLRHSSKDNRGTRGSIDKAPYRSTVPLKNAPRRRPDIQKGKDGRQMSDRSNLVMACRLHAKGAEVEETHIVWASMLSTVLLRCRGDSNNTRHPFADVAMQKNIVKSGSGHLKEWVLHSETNSVGSHFKRRLRRILALVDEEPPTVIKQTNARLLERPGKLV